MFGEQEIREPKSVTEKIAKRPWTHGGGAWMHALFARAGLLLVAAALLLYAFTLDNGLQPYELHGGDLITHQYAQVQARPSNAPGYPLYTMGGWLWYHVGRGFASGLGNALPNPIPLLSSYSTLWALLALWLLYRILCHITATHARPAGNRPVAWLLSAFLAVTYFFWYYATTTEQYSSAVAQTLAIVYVYLLWRQANDGRRGAKSGARRAQVASSEYLVSSSQPPAANRQRPAITVQQHSTLNPQSSILITHHSSLDTRHLTPDTLYLLLLAFLCGLALAHMLTVAFIVPPLIVLVLWDAPDLLRRPRVVGRVIVAAALPLLSYIYVYARGAAHPEWWGAGDWPTATAWFWDFVSTAQGREELGWGLESGRAFWGGGFPEMVWQELSVPLFVLGLVGVARLGRRLAFLLYSTLAIYFVFCWAYRYGNWYQVILPAYPLILMGVARLVDDWQFAIGHWQSPIPHSVRRLLALALLLLLTVALVWRMDSSLPAANSRNRPGDTALDSAALLLDQPLPGNARLFAAVDDALAIDYLANIWRVRPDVRVVDRKAAASALDSGESAFVTVDAAERLYGELRLDWQPFAQSATPDWVELLPADPISIPPSDMEPLGQTLLPGVTLLGYATQPGPIGDPVTQSEPSLDVTLYWQLADGIWPAGVSISLRPTRDGAFIPAGTGIIQRDAAQPLNGLLTHLPPAPGAILADAYRLPLPADQADGLAVILYRADDAGFENLAEARWSLR